MLCHRSNLHIPRNGRRRRRRKRKQQHDGRRWHGKHRGRRRRLLFGWHWRGGRFRHRDRILHDGIVLMSSLPIAPSGDSNIIAAIATRNGLTG